MRSEEPNDYYVANKANVQQKVEQLHDFIAKRKTKLFSEIGHQTEVKLKNLERMIQKWRQFRPNWSAVCHYYKGEPEEWKQL